MRRRTLQMANSKRVAGLALVALIVSACGHSDTQATKAETQSSQTAETRLRDAATLAVLVDLPANAVLISPIQISGTADSRFFHEGVFPVRLLGANGCLLGEAPAIPTGDWMVPGQVAFEATLTFRATPGTSAVLVFEQDNVGEYPLPPLGVRTLVRVAGKLDPQAANPEPTDCDAPR